MSNNITFVTHLRYDHEDRLDNLQIIIDYYSYYFPESKFIFVEDDKEHNKKFDLIKWHKKTAFYFLQNQSVYYRTRALNFGFKHAQTPIVVSLDTDCIVRPESIKLCEEALLKDSVAAWPYNGYFLDVNFELKAKFKNSNNNFNILLDSLDNNLKLPLSSHYKHCHVRCTDSDHLGTGGIVMFNKEKFTSVGGYNQNFVSWGCEDNEIVVRLKTLKLKMFRDIDRESICFHLFHRNALRSENPYYQHNFDVIHKVEKMNEEELKAYINSWNLFKK